jgi:hypothetical protein
MANQHPWHVGRLPWTLRRKGHQEIGFDLDGLPEPVSRQDAPGVLIFYGVIMGIGLGVGYLTPVKNLMLWFAKGLATGIAVAGFGLAKAIAGSISVILTVDAVFNAAGAA